MALDLIPPPRPTWVTEPSTSTIRDIYEWAQRQQATIERIIEESGSGGGASSAVDVSFTPAGTIAATNVQAAIEEVANERVPTSRTINTTAPLTGGGNLSADRTLAVNAATTTAQGVSELATTAEMMTGTDATRTAAPATTHIAWAKAVTSNAAGTTTSTTFVDWPTVTPLTMSFTKRFAATDLIIELFAGWFANATGILKWAVNVDGTDLVVINAFNNAVTSHDFRAGILQVSGLAAGAHTITMRARVNNVAVTLQCDSNDQQSLRVDEVPVGP